MQGCNFQENARISSISQRMQKCIIQEYSRLYTPSIAQKMQKCIKVMQKRIIQEHSSITMQKCINAKVHYSRTFKYNYAKTH